MKTSIEPALTRHSLSGPTMGTRWSAVFYTPAGFEPGALEQALGFAVGRVDQQMSNWKPDSDLNRLNAAPLGEWVALPCELMFVLGEGLRIGRASDGAFDIGLGAAVAAWGFGPAPTPGQAAPPRVPTRQALELDAAAGRARRTAPLALDLCGIAKGFGVDELARVMREFGIGAWLVGIDGEMRGAGVKPDGSAWAVAHERPLRGAREAMGVIELTDLAVATSGNYRHWIEVEGRIVSHTMDPATDAPLENGVASVTVLASTCLLADAWATAFLVLGTGAGLDLARRVGLDVIFVDAAGAVTATL